MKKLLAFVLLAFLTLSVFAIEKTKVCICPYNEDINAFISECPDFEIVKSSSGYTLDLLKEKDEKVFSLIKEETEASYILIPEKFEREGLNFKRIYLYDFSKNEMNLLNTEISQMETSFSFESLLPVLKNICKKEYGLLKIKDLDTGITLKLDGLTVVPVNGYILAEPGKHNVSFSNFSASEKTEQIEIIPWQTVDIQLELSEKEFSNLTVKSNIKADVVKDSIVLGKTPFLLDTYTVPTILRLKAPGYADSLVALEKETKEVFVEMRPEWMQDGDIYKKAKDDFYLAFARSILIYGAKVIFQSLDTMYPKVSEIGTNFTTVAMTVSIGDLIYDLINYSRYAHYISP